MQGIKLSSNCILSKLICRRIINPMSTVKLCRYSYGIGKGSTPACFTHNSTCFQGLWVQSLHATDLGSHLQKPRACDYTLSEWCGVLDKECYCLECRQPLKCSWENQGEGICCQSFDSTCSVALVCRCREQLSCRFLGLNST